MLALLVLLWGMGYGYGTVLLVLSCLVICATRVMCFPTSALPKTISAGGLILQSFLLVPPKSQCLGSITDLVGEHG